MKFLAFIFEYRQLLIAALFFAAVLTVGGSWYLATKFAVYPSTTSNLVDVIDEYDGDNNETLNLLKVSLANMVREPAFTKNGGDFFVELGNRLIAEHAYPESYPATADSIPNKGALGSMLRQFGISLREVGDGDPDEEFYGLARTLLKCCELLRNDGVKLRQIIENRQLIIP